MKRFIVWAVSLGAAVPLLAYAFVALVNPMPPLPFMNTLEVLCPGWIMFMITADCEYFDACSLKVLGMVVFSNAVLYGLLGLIAWGIHRARQRVTYQ